jgi:murein DD-endopeptidase MepM/ murein hydrolase activator NlpD
MNFPALLVHVTVAAAMFLSLAAADCEEQVNQAVDDLEQEIADEVPAFALPTRGYLGACWGDPGVRSEFGDPHTGIDIWDSTDAGFGADATGADVFAAFGGKVIQSEGQKIQIRHDPIDDAYVEVVPQLGVVTYYTHLSERLVVVGERVSKGQLIGRQGVGNGIVHLHFSIKRGTDDERYIQNTLDPSKYLGKNLASPECGLDTPRWHEPFGKP